MTAPITQAATLRTPLEALRAEIHADLDVLNRDKLKVAAKVWRGWELFKGRHPGATRHAYFQWLTIEHFTGNSYALLYAGLALHRGFDFATVSTAALVGEALWNGHTPDDVTAALAGGTLRELLGKLAAPDSAVRQEAHAALRKVSELETLPAGELDTRGHAILAALPDTMLQAANRAVETGQPIPDAIADAARNVFQQLTFLDWIHRQACAIPDCGVAGGIEAHHLRLPDYPGKVGGRRNHAAYLPLCRHHHNSNQEGTAHGMSQAEWSTLHWGTPDAVFAVALDLYAEFVAHIGALRS